VSILVNQVRALAHDYVRKGSKANRRLQVGRIIKFVEFIEDTERLHNLHEIGHRHVINFWKRHREFAPKTANDYWLAFCIVWRWSGKPGTPPKPIIFSKPDAAKPGSDVALLADFGDGGRKVIPTLPEISQALKTHRLSRSLSVMAISTATGLDSSAIITIEGGCELARYVDIEALSNFYFNTK